MKVILKILVAIVIVCSLSISPVYTFGSSIVFDLQLLRTYDNSTDIKLFANGPFKYFVYPEGEDLVIDIGNAKFSNDLINSQKKLKTNIDNVKNITLKNLTGNSARLSLNIDNIKEFKFKVVAPNGTISPYGINNNPNLKYNNKLKADSTDNKESDEFNDLNDTPKTSPAKVNSDEMATSETQMPDTKDLIMPETISVKQQKIKPYSNTPDNSAEHIRLDEESIVVPDNFDISELSQEEIPTKTDLNTTNKTETTPIAKPATVYNPLPADELIKRLNNNTSNPEEIPRLIPKNNEPQDVKYDNDDDASSQSEDIENSNVDQNTPKDQIISNIETLPKGKFLSSNTNSSQTLLPDGSKVVELPGTPISATEQNISPEITAGEMNLFKPRELNSLALGFFESFESLEKPPEKFAIPKPKPAYTSDGTLAFTVYSSKGTYSGKAPIKPITTVEGNNFSALKVNDNKIVEIRNKSADSVNLTFKRLITKAKELYNKGAIKESENAYKQAIATNPRQPWGYIAIAGFYELQGRIAEAIKAYESAVQLLPDKVEVIYNLALDYYKLGRYNESIYNLQRVISLSPNFTLAYYNLGTLYYKLQNYNESVEYLKKAIALNPVLTDAYYNLGLAYLSNKNQTEAVKNFDSCTNIDPYDNQCSMMFSKYKSKS